MNYGMIRNIVGKILVLIATLMVLPLLVSLIYQEGLKNFISFLIPIGGLFLTGFLMCFKKPVNIRIGVKEGFIIVSLSWIIMSLFGSIPFVISGEIPSFVDAFFEITSGFTTTGASVVTNVEELSHSMLFWRSFSHWIGGMGILVFILAFIPESEDGSSLHILRAESPGPKVGKLVSKMKVTSRILYLIYLGLTIIQILLLWLGPDEKMTLFNSVIYTFGTAGTGGFGVDATSLATYGSYSQYVIAIFMLIFGMNFTMFYMIIIGNWKEVVKNEELKVFLIVVILSVSLVVINIFSLYSTFEEAFRHSLFQVASIISTSGFATTDFNLWPTLSKIVLLIIMVFGGCAGSTAGGMKMSRVVILFKSSIRRIKSMISPRKVQNIKLNKETIDNETVEGVQNFLIVYFIVFIAVALLISIDGMDLITTFTASLTCINNVGPGLGAVGPTGSFAGFSDFSKILLSIEMIAGRLEIFPILIMFYPKTWIKR